jgi:hypothetical protein
MYTYEDFHFDKDGDLHNFIKDKIYMGKCVIYHMALHKTI